MIEQTQEWLWSGFNQIPWVVVSTFAIYFAIIIYTRIVGLRSFSKMSAGDFAMTVVVGSLFASTISSGSPSLLLGLLSLACLFAAQWSIAWPRRRCDGFAALVDNQPILLMADSQILEENLKKVNVSRNDLYGETPRGECTEFRSGCRCGVRDDWRHLSDAHG